MSPRAAWRLESLEFPQVYRYSAGKADWMAAGLPWEGKRKQKPLAADLVRNDVPTCHRQESIEAVWERTKQAGWQLCVVVNDENIVLGLLDEATLKSERQKTAEEVMDAGAKTYRPHVSAESVIKYMRNQDQAHVLVTKSDGSLLGTLLQEDVTNAVEST